MQMICIVSVAAVQLAYFSCSASAAAPPMERAMGPSYLGTTGCPKGYVPPTHQEVEAQFAKWEDEVYESTGGTTTRTGRFCRVFSHICIDQVSNSAHKCIHIILMNIL